MLITHNREKLINTILYFANEVDKCGKVKLFKLLYFLDFEHYKQTGRSVTGLEYYAWKMGPVPVALYDEIESPEPDMAKALRFGEVAVYDGRSSMLTINPKQPFDDSHFTRRELKLMSDLACQYKQATANDMIEATHLENLPWYQVYEQESAKQALIPYELALGKEELETMRPYIEERIALLKALS